ncbi:hypothetical protein [Neisseria sp. Ec49-e6-T10]|uniref:hypothetical protein n=1 Tax=Neisseria sp. Ec49-e6-T10 TaxID=3140744 RepID=UPI003EBE685E
MEPNDWTAPKSQQKPTEKDQNGSEATLKMMACAILFFLGVIGLLASACGVYFLLFVPLAVVSFIISIVVTVIIGILFYQIIKEKFSQPKRAYIIIILLSLFVFFPALFLGNIIRTIVPFF